MRLRVNMIACTGHGACAELLPELIRLDPWGYPLLADRPVPAGLADHAKRAVAACPTLALIADNGAGDASSTVTGVRRGGRHTRRA